MIKTIIFDADGVLINGDRFSDVLARDFKTDKAKEKEFFTTVFQECLVGNADLKESIAPYLPTFGWKGTADEFLDYWFKAEHSINEELIRSIRQLRAAGATVVLATNQEKYRTQYMLERMQFAGVFDKIYASAHLGLKKPDTTFFAHVVGDLGVQKDEVLFWDDDERNIAGAAQYGIHAELYTDYDTFCKIMSEKYSLLKS